MLRIEIDFPDLLAPSSSIPTYFCAPVRWFGHFSCVTFCTFVACLVHFCRQVQQFGHFCNFPAVTFFCAFACCTSIFADRRSSLATFSILHQFFTILQFSTLGPLKLLRLSTKVDCWRNCQKPWVYDTFVQKNWTVSRGIATFVHSHVHFGHDSFWIAFVIEIVIAFVMPTLAQINFTIASTTQIGTSILVTIAFG